MNKKEILNDGTSEFFDERKPRYQVFAGAIRSGKTFDNINLLVDRWYEMLGHSGVNSKKQVRDEMKQFLILRGQK